MFILPFQPEAQSRIALRSPHRKLSESLRRQNGTGSENKQNGYQVTQMFNE